MENDISLSKIKKFFQNNKRMPSYQEIAQIFGFKSKNAAYKLIRNLIEGKFVKKDSKGKLLPSSLFYSVKILGTVEAGFPSPAEEELSDTMSLDEYLIGNKESTFMVKVRGESMIDAGIMEGDMVLVERRGNAKDGDIVLAEVDGYWTMKYFKKKGNTISLEPANKKFKTILPKETLNIAAIVTAVIRKY